MELKRNFYTEKSFECGGEAFKPFLGEHGELSIEANERRFYFKTKLSTFQSDIISNIQYTHGWIEILTKDSFFFFKMEEVIEPENLQVKE